MGCITSDTIVVGCSHWADSGFKEATGKSASDADKLLIVAGCATGTGDVGRLCAFAGGGGGGGAGGSTGCETGGMGAVCGSGADWCVAVMMVVVVVVVTLAALKTRSSNISE